MTPEENYQNILTSTFGVDAPNIPLEGKTNNVIGALNDPANFAKFNVNFKNRLIRLRDYFQKKPTEYNKLLVKLKNIAGSTTWIGAYSELSAIDTLICSPTGVGSIVLDEQRSANSTYGAEYGKAVADLDLYLKDFGILADVKVLKDVVGEIVDNIINQAKKDAKNKSVNIIAEFDRNDLEDDYKRNFMTIAKELSDTIKNSNTYLNSTIKKGLSFRLAYSPRVLSAVSIMNPIELAERTKDYILKRYSYKFAKKKPFFIIQVNFPWYNQLVTQTFNYSDHYYRAIARRTFCQYRWQTTKMSALNPKFCKNTKAHKVSQKLTGIIFIDDDLIETGTTKCSVYLNPNGDNKVGTGEHYLRGLADSTKGIFEDFKYDNY